MYQGGIRLITKFPECSIYDSLLTLTKIFIKVLTFIEICAIMKFKQLFLLARCGSYQRFKTFWKLDSCIVVYILCCAVLKSLLF